MKRTCLIAVAGVALCAAASAADNPFSQFKGKMKEGMYEYKMEMDMSGVQGMPAGMGKQNMTFQKCLTQADIDKGQMGRGGGRDGKMPESCEVKNFNMSGNTASYTMICKEPKMSADNKIAFSNDGFKMDMKMAMEQGGQMMNMNQKMEGRYLGPCK
jgi:uncharacterized protein DUF3617